MSEQHNFAVGQCVRITNRNLRGQIAYIGMTSFAAGIWIGVVLDEEKGRNNGAIRGTRYFKCSRNHGLFVRPTQLSAIPMALSGAKAAAANGDTHADVDVDNDAEAKAEADTDADTDATVTVERAMEVPTDETLVVPGASQGAGQGAGPGTGPTAVQEAGPGTGQEAGAGTPSHTVAEKSRKDVGDVVSPPTSISAPAPTLVSTSASASAPPSAPAWTTSSGSSSSGANHLKTTRINQPKQVKQVFSSSSSQLSLLLAEPEIVADPAASSSCRALAGADRSRTASALPAALAVAVAAKIAKTPKAPKRSKTSVSPSESFCCSKRASFVETGFLEILKPQFTPGQPLRSPTFTIGTASNTNSNSNSNSKVNGIGNGNDNGNGKNHEQLMKIKELEGRIAGLSEEVETLKRQKADDKQRLQDLEKVKITSEQLAEFKLQIMEQHSLLQRDLQRSRQDTRDTHDALAKCKSELDDMADSVEFLTLDKEMAEEKTETLQIELELAHERIEELALDVEILRAENESHLPANANEPKANSVPTLGEWKKMEQYNQRLRETVVRLRDMLTEEKQHLQKATKELETKHSEITELHKIKKLLSQRVDGLEMHIMDLKEQVDAALGAETMVVSLANVKLELEDRLKLLEEEVAELEALEEIHEQLIESNQELEIDLRDEVDMLNAAVKSLQLQKDNAIETIYDRDLTIMKFRELVKVLTEQLQLQLQLKEAAGGGNSMSEDLSSNLSNAEELQNIDFNQVFSVTKAYGRAIDVQLNAVELKLNKIHTDYLLAFVPEDFLLRGGEHDVILVLILLKRIMEKVDIICNAIKEKFPSSCEFGKDAIFEGFSVHRFAFRSKCMYFLRSLKLVLQQLVFAFDHCDYEVCNHISIYRCEMEAQERHVDEMLRLLKNSLLDENSRTEGIEGAAAFFITLHANLIPAQELGELVNEHALHVTLLEVFEAGLDCISTNASLLHTIIKLGHENTESFWTMQFLMENVQSFKQTVKKLHHKLPTTNVICHGIERERLHRIQMTIDYIGRLINILSASAKEATRDISAMKDENGSDISIDHDNLWKIIALHCSKLGPADHHENQSPATLLRRCIELLDEQINEFFTFILEKENVKNSNVNTVFMRSAANTLLQRAAHVKEHYEDVKTLQQCIVERDKEIKTLKYVAKMKQNNFSEMQIRKEMAERNLAKLLADQDQTIQRISDYIDNVENEIRCKDFAFSHALAELSAKLSRLEATFSRLQANLNSNAQTLHNEESAREIHMLSRCLRKEVQQRQQIQADELKRKLRQLTPIHVPRKPDQKLKKLDADLRQVKHEWILSFISLKPQELQPAIKAKAHEISKAVVETYFETHPHRAIASDFGRFPTTDTYALFQ